MYRAGCLGIRNGLGEFYSRKGFVAAGGTEGEPLRLRLVLPPPSYARRGGELLVAQFARVGVKLDIVQVDWGRWLQEVFKEHHYDLTMIAHTEPLDIGIYARSAYYFNYDDPVFQALYRQFQTETRETEQKRLAGQLQTHLAEACVHGFLYQLPKNRRLGPEALGVVARCPAAGQ